MGRDPCIVEREDRIIGHHRARAAELVLHGAKPRQLLPIALGEGVSAHVSVLDKPGAHEDLARALTAHRREPHPAPGDERQPVQRHLLEHHRFGAARIPMRVEVGAAHEIAGRLLHPFRTNPPGDERVRPLGLHHLGGDDPRRNARMEDRARGKPERGPAQTGVLALGRACAHAAQQSREQGPVNPPGRGPESARADPELVAYVADLAMDIEPIPHPGRRQGIPAAEPAHRLARLVRHRPEAAPEIDDPEKIGAGVGEPGVGDLRLRPSLGTPLARIGHAQEARNDEHVGGASKGVRFEQHAPDPRIERKSREPAPDLREIAAGIDGAELAQQPQAVVDVAPVRRIDERETLHVLHPQRQHAQQHRREVCTLDLGLRVGGPRRKPGFVIEPDAHPGAGPPAPPGALIRRGTRDRFHRQPLHPGAVRIPAHPGGARVDDEADARYRQRRLRDVRREHDAAPVVGSEQRLLMRRGHSGMEGKELGVRQPEAPDPGLGLADLALSGQEDEHIARFAAQLLQRPRDLLRDVVSFLPGPIPNLDGVGTALHLDDRRLIEERAKLLDLQGGRRHDDPEIRAPQHELPEIAENEIDVEGPLVRLVDDQRVVGEQIAVALDLREQDAVGHQLDARVRRGVPAKAHLIAHELPESGAELRGDPRRDASRRDPSGLRMTDHRAGAPARPEADLRELGALARSGRADHQRDRMPGDRARDRLRLLGDRQIRGDLRLRYRYFRLRHRRYRFRHRRFARSEAFG